MNSLTTISKSRVMTDAWAIYKEKRATGYTCYNFSICLVMAWNREKRNVKYEREIEAIRQETGNTDPDFLRKEHQRRKPVTLFIVPRKGITFPKVA